MSTERSLSWQVALLLPLAAGFLGMSLSIAVRSAHAGEEVATTTAAVPTPLRNVSGTATAITVSEPMRLIIPSIGLNALVESTGLSKTGSGDIGIPSNFVDVAWYKQSPRPGDPGIAIIDGHLDGRYVPQAVFYNLNELSKGESIYVKDRQGILRQFIVTKSETLPSNADTSALFASSGTPQLVLITCAGDWIPDSHQYTDRVVVFATLAGESLYI